MTNGMATRAGSRRSPLVSRGRADRSCRLVIAANDDPYLRRLGRGGGRGGLGRTGTHRRYGRGGDIGGLLGLDAEPLLQIVDSIRLFAICIVIDDRGLGGFRRVGGVEDVVVRGLEAGCKL